MMAHVDLCSGIGGFALGFQWAGLSKPVLFCDIEPWSRKVLHKHWPDVPIAEDVKELANDPDRNVPNCDILTGGYPCQPFSLAGKRLGHADDRHIWPYILQIVAQKRPAWCCFENVYGHVSMGLDQVLLDLEGQGYASRTFIVPACGVDAPHLRFRAFIIAHTDSHREPNGPINGSQGQRLDVGNASRSRQCWNNGRRSGQKPENRCEDVADTDSPRCEEQRRSQPAQAKHQAPQCRSGWLTEPAICGMANGIPRWLDEPRDTPRTVKGVKGRADRLKGLGNAIVPQIAQKIGEAIKQCEAEL